MTDFPVAQSVQLDAPIRTPAEAVAFGDADLPCPSDPAGAEAWGDRAIEALVFNWLALVQAHEGAQPGLHQLDRLYAVVLAADDAEPIVRPSGRLECWRAGRTARERINLDNSHSRLMEMLMTSPAFLRAEPILCARFRAHRPDPLLEVHLREVPLLEEGALRQSLMDAGHACRWRAHALDAHWPPDSSQARAPRF